MNKLDITDFLKDSKIIASLRTDDDIKAALDSNINTVFLLDADIMDIERKVYILKNNGKNVFLHIDLIRGLSHDNSAVDFISTKCRPDGLLTTKKSIITKAKEAGLYSIFRMFALDSRTISSVSYSINGIYPDAIEILPGIAPKAISLLKNETNIPLITGGLITEKEEISSALSAGAISVSTSKHELWK